MLLSRGFMSRVHCILKQLGMSQPADDHKREEAAQMTGGLWKDVRKRRDTRGGAEVTKLKMTAAF
jgi:hypothetical protein